MNFIIMETVKHSIVNVSFGIRLNSVFCCASLRNMHAQSLQMYFRALLLNKRVPEHLGPLYDHVKSIPINLPCTTHCIPVDHGAKITGRSPMTP